MNRIKRNAKAVASLAVGLLTAVSAIGLPDPWARYVAIGTAVAGAVIVWATPNAPADEESADATGE